jgi:hypothetical protein
MLFPVFFWRGILRKKIHKTLVTHHRMLGIAKLYKFHTCILVLISTHPTVQHTHSAINTLKS